MALDPNIALQVRGLELPKPLEQAGQAAQVVSLQKLIEEQDRKKAAHAELAALGPNPTQEQLAGWAGKHAGPEAVMRVQQASLDRQAGREQTALHFAQSLNQKQESLDQARAQFMQRTQDQAAQREFNEWYKTESLRNQREANSLQAQLRAMGLEIKRQDNQLRLEKFDRDKHDREEREIEGQIGKTADRMKDVQPVFTAAQQLNSILGRYTPETVPGLGYAKNTDVGKVFLTDEGKDVSSSIKLFGNSVLKAMSGTAVTAPEEIRQMAAQMADGRFGAQDFYIAWPKMAAWVNDQVALGTSGLTPKAKERFIQRTGLKLDAIAPRYTFDGGKLNDTRGAAQLPKVTSDADFDKLPSGTEFLDPQGQKRKKP
jgi:hypothetical protein